MRLYVLDIESESGYPPATLRVVAEDAVEAIQKGVARYLHTTGGCARVTRVKDEGSVVL